MNKNTVVSIVTDTETDFVEMAKQLAESFGLEWQIGSGHLEFEMKTETRYSILHIQVSFPGNPYSVTLDFFNREGGEFTKTLVLTKNGGTFYQNLTSWLAETEDIESFVQEWTEQAVSIALEKQCIIRRTAKAFLQKKKTYADLREALS